MALIQIPARHYDRYPTAGLNPAQVVAVYFARRAPRYGFRHIQHTAAPPGAT
ncbi:hypothetical protein [Burkholderia pseudomallei]|uniref:hypothetical protein n=1 Tax=Burkholderia pseudomallei TaxID=28450 RepID=UPI0012F51667|nr:hypothetical protein [Burkholderia pseudomallei]